MALPRSLPPPPRQVTLLQRKAGKLGKGLGKTTGWIHRAALQMKQVEMIGGVNYERITPQGLFVSYGEQRKDGQLIECDTIVLCTGQEPLRELQAPLQAAGLAVAVVPSAVAVVDLHDAVLGGQDLVTLTDHIADLQQSQLAVRAANQGGAPKGDDLAFGRTGNHGHDGALFHMLHCNGNGG